VSSIKNMTAVSGFARGAASARVRTVAPIAWMSGVGVCPTPDQLRSRIGDAGPAIQSFEKSRFTYLTTRQLKHDVGSTVLRPPV